MAERKRNRLTRESDLEKIQDMYLLGLTQEEIARKIGVSRSQITYDIAALRDRWVLRTTLKLDHAKAEELAKIDRIERELWKAWEESRGEFTSTIVKAGAGRHPHKEVSKRTEKRVGDPRFLDGIQWCISKRCEILGLSAPKKLHVAVDDEHEWSEADVRRIAARALNMPARKN